MVIGKFVDPADLLPLFLKEGDLFLNNGKILILPMKLHQNGFQGVQFLGVLLLQLPNLKLIVRSILFNSLLEVFHLTVIASLHILKRLYQLLQHIHKTFSLLLVSKVTRNAFGSFGLIVIGTLNFFPEGFVFGIEDFDSLNHLIDLLILVLILRILIIELFDGLRQLRIDFDQLFKRLL